MLIAIGVDGAPAGWAAACLHGGDEPATELRLLTTVEQLTGLRGRASVAIDVPIGLLRSVDLRPCDREARRRLRGRASTVFAPPSRPMLPLAGDYPAMRALVDQERRGSPAAKGLSAQAAAIAPKVAEVDAWARSHPACEAWLFECHPELSFAAMNGGEPLPGKRSPSGLARRLELVRERFPDAEDRLAAAPWPRGAVGADDLLDAYAALATALRCARGEHELLGGERDSEGVSMRIAV